MFFRPPRVRHAALAAAGCGAAACVLLPQAEPARRVGRAAGVAALIAADYQWLALAHPPPPPPPPLGGGAASTPATANDDERQRAHLAARSATHARSAERLRALCDAHGGLWVKV